MDIDCFRHLVKSLHSDESEDDRHMLENIDNEKVPLYLEDVGYKLDSSASDFSPIIGRKTEMRRLIQVLLRKDKNNPILVGEPGVGKNTIVEGLAYAISKENVPHSLLDKKIFVLDLASILAGTKYRGQFEERLKKIINDLSKDKNIILFINEIHTLIGAGSSQGSIDAANILKPALAHGKIQCIGSTTLVDYRKYFEKDATLARLFQKIFVKEPNENEVFDILLGIKTRYEKFHHVEYTEEALKKVVSLSARYLPDLFFPDKAINVLDESGAMKKISDERRPESLVAIEKKIDELQDEKKGILELQDYEKAIVLRDEVKELKRELTKIKDEWKSFSNIEVSKVEVRDIEKTISVITNIPEEHMSEGELEHLRSLDDILNEKIVGQYEAIRAVSSTIRRNRCGLSAKERPIGSLLFLGPTGVGKTLLAKTLAEHLFGSSSALIRIDMSDYMEKHSVSRLVGAPPGYIGFEEGGVLTDKIRNRPYSVVLLDEIEKASPDVFNILLQVLEEGELQDSSGRIINFRNTIILMTSNAGSRSIIKESIPGFSLNEDGLMEYKDIKANAMDEIKRFLSPEFINRLDDIVVFSPLYEDSIKKIFFLELKKLESRLEDKKIKLNISDEVVSYFIKEGYQPSYGARPMRRLIQSKIEEELSMMIIEDKVKDGSKISMELENNKIKLKVSK